MKTEAVDIGTSDRAVLALRWNNGEYAQYKRLLMGFVHDWRDSIVTLIESGQARDATQAAAMVVAQVKTVSPQIEIADQIKAINDELWYRGAADEGERESVAEAWARTHASAWRQWRVKEYVFVLEQIAPDIELHLGALGCQSGAAQASVA